VLEQTRRHLAVVALLRVPHVIVAVNKIDLIGFSADAFTAVADQARAVAAELGILDLHVLPVSALEGDNIVDRSARTPWYDGPALLELLETLPVADEADRELEPLRLPVQLVLRPQGGLAPEVAADPAEVERLRDYRAVAGRISSGSVRVGDRVEIFPAGIAATVTGIRSAGTPVDEAVAPLSVSLEFDRDIDAARGALVVAAGTLPAPRREVEAELFQLDARPLTPGVRVLVKHGTTTVQAIVAQIESRYDLDTLTHEPAQTLQTNDIGRVRLRLASDLPIEAYQQSRHSGSFLVIHPSDGATLAAGIARD
jgi:sulfate adenylyltransferase subunit 1